MVHSKPENALINPKADKLDGTQLFLDDRAQDKNEDEDGIEIPPPLFKKSPEDDDEGLRSPATLAKMDAAREITRQQRAAQEISSSSMGEGKSPSRKIKQAHGQIVTIKISTLPQR
jgi:hypothetical protein